MFPRPNSYRNRLNLGPSPPDRIPAPWNIVNFYQCSEDPWLPAGLVPNAQSLGSLGPVTYDFQDYRSVAIPSECDTLPGDSGYGDSGPTFSTIETEPSVHEDDRTDTQGVEQLINNFKLGPQRPSYAPSIQLQLDTLSNSKFRCNECSASVKTRSELKKHQQRHSKPNKCSYPDCPKSKDGFSTPNDLVRHKRTVHGEHKNYGTVYVCIHEPCTTKKRKPWPRADNFRSHLMRAHNVELKADADFAAYVYRSDEAGSHVLQGVGTSVAGIDPDSRSMQLQDPPTLMDESASVDTNLTENGSDGMQGAFSNRANGPHGALRSLEEGSELTENGPRSDILGDLEINSSDQQSSETFPQMDDNDSTEDDVMEDMSADRDPADETRSEAFNNKDWAVPQTEPSCDSSGSEADTMSSGASESRQTQRSDESSPIDLLSTVVAEIRMGDPRLLEFLRQLPKSLLETALKGEGGETEKDESKAFHVCPQCPKSFMRPCELKKHKKRHEKPYGCTFRSCTKSFGSKNDWKRHESSQHFQLETWNCDLPNCHNRYSRREEFKRHLLKDHGLEDAQEVDDKLERCRLGRHCDPRFWCGFCVKVIEIKDTNANSWTRRCDHIDNHLFGKDGLPKKTMSDWQYMEVDTRLSESSVRALSDSSDRAERLRGRKRRCDGDGNPRRLKRPNRAGTWMWTCCNCSQNMNLKTTSMCLECNHAKCTENCSVEVVINQDQDIELVGQGTDAP